MDVRAETVFINQTRTELGLSIAALSVIDGKLSSTLLSTAIAGQRELKPADVERLKEILNELETIQREHSPWRLSFENALAVKTQLEARRAARLAVMPRGVYVHITGPGIPGAFF